MSLTISDGQKSASRIFCLRSGLALVFLVSALLPEYDAQAQTNSPPAARGVVNGMATRTVARYLAFERDLEDALIRHDRTGAAAFLADDFELRGAANETTDSAEMWLKREMASQKTDGAVRDLSVREIDDIAIVSFLLDRGAAGKSTTATYFVTDVWRQSSQRLLVRSIARAADAQKRANRPSGRE